MKSLCAVHTALPDAVTLVMTSLNRGILWGDSVLALPNDECWDQAWKGKTNSQLYQNFKSTSIDPITLILN